RTHAGVTPCRRCSGSATRLGTRSRSSSRPSKRAFRSVPRVLQFIQVWDDLLVGLLFLQSPDVRPITVGLATIPSQRLLDVPLLMAGSLISALPAAIVYLIFQRSLISGLTMGISK